MSLISKEVEIRLNSRNIKHYKNKGYQILRNKNKLGKIKVKIEDLLNNSTVKVDIECNNCKSILNIEYRIYKKYVKENDKYFCKKCALQLFGIEKTKQTKLKKRGSIIETHPHLIKYFANQEDLYNYSAGSNKKVLMRCPDCKYEELKVINNLFNQGFFCQKCNDGISYPEKFMFNFLEQLNIDFIKQLSKNNFKWCKNYRYDFYLPDYDCIIETHGEQHYIEKNSDWNSLKDIQEKDKLKEELASINNIKHYIIIDCKKSNLEWIKNSIMNSILPILLNFKEEDIDWSKCHENGLNNSIKIACELWNSGIKSTIEIGNKLRNNRTTIINYLKQGAELGWCNYNPKDEMRKIGILKRKSVICLTTNEIFNSLIEAEIKYDAKNISRCCSGKYNFSGKHPITGEKLHWAYYNKDK